MERELHTQASKLLIEIGIGFSVRAADRADFRKHPLWKASLSRPSPPAGNRFYEVIQLPLLQGSLITPIWALDPYRFDS